MSYNEYFDKLYDDVFPSVNRGQICSHCGYFGKAKEMTFDPELGWMHWKCLGRFRRMEKQEQRFEYEMDQVRAKKRGQK